MLSFRVGGDRLSVPAAIVREVSRLPRITRVPHAPASLLGLGNFRGSVLPVVSFARLTGRETQGERRVILLDTADPLALAVDDVAALGQDDDARRIDIEQLIARDFQRADRKARAVARSSQAPASDADAGITLVAFTVAGQDYALPIAAVQEVLRLPADITLLPHADDMVVGSIVVRDALLPLLSLQSLLALPGDGDAERARVLVVKIGTHRVGLVVDRMDAILRVPEAQIDTVPAVLARGSAEARIQAICRLDGGQRLVSVLAVEHLIREDLTARLLQGADELMAERTAEEALAQFLLFRIGKEEFGLPIEAVVEVARPPAKLTRLPRAPAFVQGVMNLRGQVIPVIDQARRFGSTVPPSARRRVIVVRLCELQAGFVVEAVSDVMRVPVGAIRAAPDLGGEQTRVFDRVVNLGDEGRIVLIVSPQELLDRAEREMLGKLGGKLPAAAS
ncbi:chemotaxis protein CheW [Sphingomonas sp. BIUV-7]|uniref:Chemotaxis protein CheW n=1 Tax=Sphingomonas natans TaxID=3063330 RepID=A0ABT8YEE7_9SPHN|nr:chemotaxis protein CheW [Sphingomonas sp. BIUV-7]MDO6416717.1 chemotaxis protein CheW [Sphingomonas sp. BIUV-7]